VSRALEFTGKHIGFGHGQSRTFAGEQRNTRRGIADQHHASLGPAVHSDLTYAIIIHVTDLIHRFEDLRHAQRQQLV
jgi:hypothetical protein